MPRVRSCGYTASGHEVVLVRRGDTARWTGVTTCGSVWACPVCSASIWAKRGAELVDALDTWHEQGGRVAMVTLTMRHGLRDTLQSCWDALSGAWRAASGGSSAVRDAKDAAGVAGWVRRVECTWGARHGWHLHVHALVFVRAGVTDQLVDELGAAMFSAWAARLRRVGLTPLRDQGGLRVKLLELDEARDEVAGYVAKGGGESLAAAAELTGGGKLGRNGNVTPWEILDSAIAGDRRGLALWHEWEQASLGRRALTWSRDIRSELALGDELDDEELAELDDQVDDVDEPVAVWPARDWPALRDHAVDLLEVAEGAVPEWAGAAVHGFCVEMGLPLPRPPDL